MIPKTHLFATSWNLIINTSARASSQNAYLRECLTHFVHYLNMPSFPGRKASMMEAIPRREKEE
tara:strand:+ start:672 stop:863 length:192 start_codon:yes stop_codon:yes gene_type:complete